MSAEPSKIESPWAPYEPDEKAPWNLRRVWHLHRRAGFAATWGEIQRDLKDGPKASVDRVLSGKAASEGVRKNSPRPRISWETPPPHLAIRPGSKPAGSTA
jgi:hypothetical protein